MRRLVKPWIEVFILAGMASWGLSDWVESLRAAGRVARKVREEAYRLVRPGYRLLEVCERLESMILDEGARPAFPCNISVDEVAAHFSPMPGEAGVIPPNSLVKVDVGVSVDGYIADTAVTVVLNPRLGVLAEAAEAALREVLRIVRHGATIQELGYVAQRTIEGMGLKPIKNLTGHEIARYNLHAGLSIPSVAVAQPGRLQKDHVYAVEPFVTTRMGAGEVVSARNTTIFRVDAGKLLSMKLGGGERELAKLLAERFDSLPYSPRWIPGYERYAKLHERMVRRGRIHGYPVLVERRGEPVAQAEHTILVTEDGCEVIT